MAASVFFGDERLLAGADREQRVAVARQEGDARRTGDRRKRATRGQPLEGQLGRHRGVSVDLGRERMELQSDEELLQPPEVGLGAAEGRRIEWHRQVHRDLDQAAREQGVLAMRAQALSDFALDLVGVLEQGRQAPVLGDPFLGRDLPDAGHAGDVVDAVAHECQHVADLAGGNAEERGHARVVQEDLFARVEDADPVPGDQLQHVFVGRHDDHVVTLGFGLLGERADDVVGLVAGQLDDRDPIGRQGLADLGELRGEIVRHRHAVGLVLGVRLVPLGPLRPVPGGGQKVGTVLPDHLAEHRDETVNGVGRPARGRREALDRVVGAVDVRHRVDQIERRAGRRHGSRILCGALSVGAGRTSKRRVGAPFGEIRALLAGGIGRADDASKLESGQEFAGKETGGKNKNARPVAGVARFNSSYSRKLARRCQGNSFAHARAGKLFAFSGMA